MKHFFFKSKGYIKRHQNEALREEVRSSFETILKEIRAVRSSKPNGGTNPIENNSDYFVNAAVASQVLSNVVGEVVLAGSCCCVGSGRNHSWSFQDIYVVRIRSSVRGLVPLTWLLFVRESAFWLFWGTA